MELRLPLSEAEKQELWEWYVDNVRIIPYESPIEMFKAGIETLMKNLDKYIKFPR